MNQITRLSLLVALTAAGAMLAGCGQTYERQVVLVGVAAPMTTEDVVTATDAGVGEADLISLLEQRGYGGTLTTDDVDGLRADGVPDAVIDWMLAHPESAGLSSARAYEVVYVEREPSVDSTVDVSFGSGSSRHDHAHHRAERRERAERRDRDDEDDGSHTRTIQGKNGRVYRFTSGH
jgi:hypothetical protein